MVEKHVCMWKETWGITMIRLEVKNRFTELFNYLQPLYPSWTRIKDSFTILSIFYFAFIKAAEEPIIPVDLYALRFNISVQAT